MDIEKLIERLKEPDCDECTYEEKRECAGSAKCVLSGYAAEALSTLQVENEKLKDQLYDGEGVNLVNYWIQQAKIEENGHRNCQAENEKLQVELEQMKRERDAAVQCIKGIAKSGRVWMCPHCVHAKDTTDGIADCELDIGVCMMPYSSFEWRGQKED